MKNLLIIIIIAVIVICGFFIITNNADSGYVGGYATPEALQSRIDYNLKIIWEIEQRYKTTDTRRMSPRDAKRYITAKRNLSKAIAEYNYLIRSRQYQQKGYYYKY